MSEVGLRRLHGERLRRAHASICIDARTRSKAALGVCREGERLFFVGEGLDLGFNRILRRSVLASQVPPEEEAQRTKDEDDNGNNNADYELGVWSAFGVLENDVRSHVAGADQACTCCVGGA